jgi:TolB-like protein/DNA-binding winged helix-turn-helix (wHTH) protein/Tfp pilus assembly protein PilF
MAPAVAGRESYRVGDLVVDVGLQRVTGPAGEIALPKLSFDLFLALIRRAPDLVSNDELAATVWSGIVVSPETVTKRVNLLREALGDDSANSRYIIGLRGRGYRVLSAVDPLADDSARAGEAALREEAAVAVDAPKASRGNKARPAILVAVLALLVAVGFGAWWAARKAPERASVPQPTGEGLAGSTVAVLPFENLSASPDDAYLATGIPEMILDRLSQIPQLTVVASGSALRAGDGAQDVRAIGERLGARFLLLGSTQRVEERLRVSARLVDAGSGRTLWSTRLDRKVGDLFAIQDEVSEQAANELRMRISSITLPAPGTGHEPSIEAQLAYLKGRSLLSRYTVRGSEDAAAKFEEAVALDPEFTAAMAGVFDARMMSAERRHSGLEAALTKWRPVLDRALEIDPECGPAYVARAIWVRGDPRRQEADFRRGLALDPSNGRGLVAFSEFLDAEGRYDEAGQVLDRAMQVDPLSPRLHFHLVMRDFKRYGVQYREAGLERVLAMDPDYQPALQRYSKTRWLLHGDVAGAAQIMEHALAVDPENPWSRHTLAAIYLDLGDEAAAREIADGSDSSRQSQSILMALYRGDWKTAGEAALSPAGVEYNLAESWGVPEAVRDYAVMTGDRRRVIEFLEKRYKLQGTEPALDIYNFRAAAYLAQLLQLDGDGPRARRLLDRLPQAIDASLPLYGAVFALRTKATVQLLAGDRAAALQTLGDSFAADDVMQWWYTLQFDPLWKPFHADPVFTAIAAQVRTRVAQQQATVAQLRGDGRIASRGPSGTHLAR